MTHTELTENQIFNKSMRHTLVQSPQSVCNFIFSPDKRQLAIDINIYLVCGNRYSLNKRFGKSQDRSILVIFFFSSFLAVIF